MLRTISALAGCLFVVFSTHAAEPRKPQWPLKTARTLWSDQQIAEARRNIATYPEAKKVADDFIRSAGYWLDWKDEDLVRLITDSRVPRAFEVGVGGCPNCGKKMLEKVGQYGWTIDPKIPFKVKCPSCNGTFPSNDYATYYRSDLQDKKGWDTKYVDDGWGWVGPDGDKYWLVAYWNHWVWHKHVAPGLRSLGRAYLLTGDKRYAHKALVMLRRVAEVYPGMDHAKQSRYGQLMAARGGDYPGKVVNHIWETGLATNITEAYDDIWETIDGDTAAQKLFNSTGEQLRAFIEANFLEDAIDAYFSGRIRGNFGMHQTTLVHLGIVRQFGPKDKWFDELLNKSSSDSGTLGLNYALYNLITRDGMPDENSPGYNFLWVNQIATYGDLLATMGQDVYAIPRTRRLFEAVLNQVICQKRTPAIGDAGTHWGYLEGTSPQTFQPAYRHYKDPRFAQWLHQMGATGASGFRTFESLFAPLIEADRNPGPQKSRLFDAYGQVILNNTPDTLGLSMFYGFLAGHGHFDRLNIEIYDGVTPILPDLGYPDAMNTFQKGIYSWSKNTISHNTVTVDAQRQLANVPGKTQLFADSPFARIVDVEAGGTYPQCPTYRRAVVMVDVDPKHSYYVDFFTVAGGKQHDYSLHGPPGEFQIDGGGFSTPEPGTLAGRDVAVGYLYDAPEMEAKGYNKGYGGYLGSGFQHLTNVQRSKSTDWVARYQHARAKDSRMAIRVLDQPEQEIILADARVSPVKHPEIIKYIIARRQGENLKSRFVSVIEPYSDKPVVQFAKRVKIESADAIIVSREGGATDVILYDTQPGPIELKDFDARTDAPAAVFTFDADKRLTRIFTAGGTQASVAQRQFKMQPLAGQVVSMVPSKSMVTIKLDKPATDPAALIGKVITFVNDKRRVAHTVTAATQQGSQLTITLRDDLLIGRFRVESTDKNVIKTFTAMPLAVLYPGATVCTASYKPIGQLASVGRGALTVKGPRPVQPAGSDVWLTDTGPGDRFEMPGAFALEAMK